MLEVLLDPLSHWPLCVCKCSEAGERSEWTPATKGRLCLACFLPELTSEVLLPYKWDKVFSNCWLKLKPNSHVCWRQFVCMWKEIVRSYRRLTEVSWINEFLCIKLCFMTQLLSTLFEEVLAAYILKCRAFVRYSWKKVGLIVMSL